MPHASPTNATGARNVPPFRADHVGSFLRPKVLLDARGQYQSGAIDAAKPKAASP